MMMSHLYLGDNIFYGTDLERRLKNAVDPDGGVVFAYHVKDPERYGVVEFDEEHNAYLLRKNRKNQNQIMLFQVFIFMIIQWLK